VSFSIYDGDSLLIDVTITDEQGAALDISGAVFRWRLVGASQSVAKSTDNGITITNAQQGGVEIRLEPADTSGLSGVFQHELEMTDSQGNVSTVLRDKITIQTGLN
jgi:hypothetical protein